MGPTVCIRQALKHTCHKAGSVYQLEAPKQVLVIYFRPHVGIRYMISALL